MKKPGLFALGAWILVMAAPASGDQERPRPACDGKRSELAGLEARARTAKEYVAWIPSYRRAKAELDESVNACVATTKPFAQGPISRSKNPTCPGNFMNPCAYDCFPGNKKPPIDLLACRELFCKKGLRITRGYSVSVDGAQGAAYTAQAESGGRFEMIQSMNQDRDRLRAALGFKKSVGDDPDPEVLEREATAAKTEVDEKLASARALFTTLCSN